METEVEFCSQLVSMPVAESVKWNEMESNVPFACSLKVVKLLMLNEAGNVQAEAASSTGATNAEEAISAKRPATRVE